MSSTAPSPGAAQGPGGPPGDAAGPYPVLYVSDGDTFAINRGRRGDRIREVIRVLSIDTPETKRPGTPVECFGPEASTRAEGLLEGARVWLEDDPAAGSTDVYGRRLAHVWLEDGRLFAWVMVREGLGRHDGVRGRWLVHDGELEAAQDLARADGAGLWSSATCQGDVHRPAAAT